MEHGRPGKVCGRVRRSRARVLMRGAGWRPRPPPPSLPPRARARAGELGIDAFADIVMLYLLHLMGAAEQGVLRKAEFVSGMGRAGASRVSELRSRLPALRAQLTRAAHFSPFFTWAYDFQCEVGQKTVSLETAVELSKLMITPERWPLVGRWLEFLESGKKTVSKDCWRQLLPYMTTCHADVARHDENVAWPSMLDDFRDFVAKQPMAR